MLRQLGPTGDPCDPRNANSSGPITLTILTRGTIPGTIPATVHGIIRIATTIGTVTDKDGMKVLCTETDFPHLSTNFLIDLGEVKCK